MERRAELSLAVFIVREGFGEVGPFFTIHECSEKRVSVDPVRLSTGPDSVVSPALLLKRSLPSLNMISGTRSTSAQSHYTCYTFFTFKQSLAACPNVRQLLQRILVQSWARCPTTPHLRHALTWPLYYHHYTITPSSPPLHLHLHLHISS